MALPRIVASSDGPTRRDRNRSLSATAFRRRELQGCFAVLVLDLRLQRQEAGRLAGADSGARPMRPHPSFYECSQLFQTNPLLRKGGGLVDGVVVPTRTVD